MKTLRQKLYVQRTKKTMLTEEGKSMKTVSLVRWVGGREGGKSSRT